MDTGVFDQNRYFDVTVEYAKASVEDILIRITIANRGPETATLDLLPTVWLRNTWSWNGTRADRPLIYALPDASGFSIEGTEYGTRRLYAEGAPDLLFTENETNNEQLFGSANVTPYVKDGFHRCVVHNEKNAVNPERTGTKAAAHYRLAVEP